MANLKVSLGITVDEQTTNTCLRLIELYVNQNNVALMARKDENGEFHYWFENK